MGLSAYIRGLLVGTPFGDALPPRPATTPTAVDGRTAALRILRRYISELTFYRSGAKVADATGSSAPTYGPPIAFTIPERAIFIEGAGPSNPKAEFPNIAVEPGKGENGPIGLGTFVADETRDVYGFGTVLQYQSQYDEDFTLVVTASERAERRAIGVGLESALVPVEQMYGVRFVMPDYYGRLVTFTLNGATVDDSQAKANRRILRLAMSMTFVKVALVNYVEMVPDPRTEVTDDQTMVVEVEAGDP